MLSPLTIGGGSNAHPPSFLTRAKDKMNEENNTQVIEINGVKMEVDMRHAKRVDTIRVGTKVKLLINQYNDTAVKHGVVVGFDDFESLPTIIVCYLDVTYSEAKLEFAYVNTKSKEKYEIVVSVDDDLPVQKQDVLSRMDREIERKRTEIEEIERKRQYFLSHFNKYFEKA